MKNKQLKVRWTRYDHSIKGKHAHYLPPPVPFVLLKGYWLEESGFKIDDIVDIEIDNNKLILTTELS